MADSSRSGILGLVLVAGAVTALVTVVRLYGELNGWNPTFFSPEAGGALALVGVTWLPIVFGFMFGRRLCKNGQGPRSIKLNIILPLVGIAGVAGALFLMVSDWKDLESIGRVMRIAPGAAALLVLCGWFRAGMANLLYGILARVPVVLVQYMALLNAWGTHYEKGPPGNKWSTIEIGNNLAWAQLTLWVPFTVIVGGLFAAIGAATARKAG